MIMLGKLLRRRGVAIAREELDRRPWTMMQVITEHDIASGMRRLVVRDAQAAPGTLVQVELFQVSVAFFATDQFVLRGIERLDVNGRPAAVVQELACKPMPELGGQGWLSPRAQGISPHIESLTA